MTRAPLLLLALGLTGCTVKGECPEGTTYYDGYCVSAGGGEDPPIYGDTGADSGSDSAGSDSAGSDSAGSDSAAAGGR